MSWGMGYVRNGSIMQNADLSEIKQETIKRSKRYYNTMTFEDIYGNLRFRIADTWRSGYDAVLIHRSRAYAKINWHKGVDRGFLWKVAEIVRDHFGYEKYGLRVSHFNMRDPRVYVSLDTGVPDLTENRGHYRSTVHMDFVGYPGMSVPANKRLDYLQGFKDSWAMRKKADELCKTIFKRGTGRQIEGKVQLTKWEHIKSCPDCQREMQVLLDTEQAYNEEMLAYGKAHHVETPDEIEEGNTPIYPPERPKSLYLRFEELENTMFNHFMARPVALTQDGELPFSRYSEDSEFPTNNDHIIAHIEQGVITPEMIMCAALLHNTSNWKSVAEMIDQGGRQVLKVNWTSINTLRYIVRVYLLKRIGLPTWRY